MPLLQIEDRLDVQDPVLVIAISGWVDGGMVATRVGEHLTGLGRVVAEFRADDIYDYQSNRPTLEIAGGATADIVYPALAISSVSSDSHDLLVLTGTEPSSKWQGISAELAALAETLGVTKVVAVGAIPAMVPHTRATPIITTSTDPAIEPSGIPAGRLVVPAALVNVAAHQVATSNDIPEIGIWAQVPHYVSGVYWPGVEAVVTRLATQIGIHTPMEELTRAASEMISRLDAAVAAKPEAQQFIRELEEATPGFAIDDTTDLGDEIEEFLRSLGEEG
jgi:PAC2 family